MKALFYKALLLLLILSSASCKTQDQKYKAFYKKIQLKSIKQETITADTIDCCEYVSVISKNLDDLNKSLDEWEKVVFAPRTLPDEDAEEAIIPVVPQPTPQRPTASLSPTPASRVSVVPRADIKPAPQPEPEPPAPVAPKEEVAPVQPTPPPAQVETLNPVKETPQIITSTPDVFNEAAVKIISGEGDLKKYSVVIASLSKKEGANRLKAIFFAETSEKFWIAQNNKDIYYFLVGTYDSREEAVKKKNQLVRQYTSRYTKSQLLSKFGIPFTDLWILIKP